MNRPADEFIASFVGVETILTGKVVSTDSSGFLASVAGHEGKEVTASFKATAIHVLRKNR